MLFLSSVLFVLEQQRRSNDSVVSRGLVTASSVLPSVSVASAATPEVEPVVQTVSTRGGVACEKPHMLVDVPKNMSIRSVPNGRSIAQLPSGSTYLGTSMRAWVQSATPDGKWGKVTIPWGGQVNKQGWIPLTGLQKSFTSVLVVGDLSERKLSVYRGCELQFEAPSAIGAAGSPSPTGRFWVTDRVEVPKSQPYFGTYAFGLSTIQPRPPKGWTGGNQMAIHGTNTPGSIGTAASAGCLRVSESTLARLKASVGLGTPVVITR